MIWKLQSFKMYSCHEEPRVEPFATEIKYWLLPKEIGNNNTVKPTYYHIA
jgi:hypothetical protein